MAHQKKRSVVGWSIIGFLFGFIGVIIIAFLKPKEEE